MDPPRVAAYQAFAKTVMQRYKAYDPAHTGHPYRGIANYQVWNEPNISTYWGGTLPQLAELVRAAWQVRNQVDTGAKILGPSMVTRLPFEMKGIKQFYALKVAKKPVWSYIDAMTFSLYPVDIMPNGRPGGPEDMVTLVQRRPGDPGQGPCALPDPGLELRGELRPALWGTRRFAHASDPR